MPIMPATKKESTNIDVLVVALKQEAMKNSGKPGHNPYLWIHNNLPNDLIESARNGNADSINKLTCLKVDTSVQIVPPKETQA